jgi:hypothetical protein
MAIQPNRFYRTITGLLAVLMAAAAVTTAAAQTTPQAKIAARPMTRDDIAAYKLPATTELTGGLFTIGVGQPAYLEAQLDITVAASDILSTDWALTTKPAGSSALLTESPIGNSVPIYEPSDRLAFQVAGRKLLRPDVAGIYVVTATIATRTATVNLAQTLVAATYVGINTCSSCHSGGLADVKVPAWSKTLHSEVFKDNIDGLTGQTSYGSSCFGCHTVGYDTAATAPNGGFSDVMAKLGWTPPAATKVGNFDAVPDALKNLANIQCENCHGPGSLHAGSGGWPVAISLSSDSGVCSQCHAAATHHVKGTEWNNSRHAVTTRDASGAGREACVGCHTGSGFIQRANAAKAGTAFSPMNTSFNPINCQTCHEPHGQTVPDKAAHQVRTLTSVKLADGTMVTKGGTGMLCMNCHQSRMSAAAVPTTQGSSHFGPHHSPQADMLQGVNGFTYGKTMPSSAHEDVVPDTCATCHMQAMAATDPALTFVGGHTFKPSMAATATLPAKQLVGACQTCHGPDVTTFDFALFDYNGDGVTEGVQTEVQHLLDQLSALLPPDNKPKTSLNIDSTWTPRQLEAAYNWLFVNNDGSRGIHNTAYTVGLLKASIADLSGNATK